MHNVNYYNEINDYNQGLLAYYLLVTLACWCIGRIHSHSISSSKGVSSYSLNNIDKH